MTGVAGVILAGGLSRRMGGGDKALLQLAGKPLLLRVVERARPQVDSMIINANGDPERFAGYGLAVVPDVLEGFAGPLAGILSAMEWAAAEAPGCPWLASFAADTPFLPVDLVDRLRSAAEAAGAVLACARSAGRSHPLSGLWSVALRHDLRLALVEEDMRKVEGWMMRHAPLHVDFGTEPVDPFFNINRPEDLAAAQKLAAQS